MLLNASIIYDELRKMHKAEMLGSASDDLSLMRPEFYLDGESVFLANHLYIASVEHLPQRPQFGKGSVLVVIGTAPVLNSYKNKTCVIVIKDRADFFKVYQEVQDIFNTYDKWERSLYINLAKGADASTFLSDAAQVFDKPLFLLDQSFKLIASSNATPDLLDQFQGQAGSLNVGTLSEYLDDAKPMLNERKPTVINLLDRSVLSTNLFNEDDEYEGCFFIYAHDKIFRDADLVLSEFFTRILELAIKRDTTIINNEKPSLKMLLHSLLGEMPLSPSQRVLLEASNNTTTYVCAVIQHATNSEHLPSSYVCNALEQAFQDSYAFPYNDAVVGFIDVGPFQDAKTGQYSKRFTSELSDFLANIHLCAGISNDFKNLFDIRLHFFQAESAIEHGRLISPDDQLFFFSTYALVEMIINSLGGKPAQTYYPKGLTDIVEHDEHAGVSYLETLRVFLEENMSYSAAANRLYIHRSTLVDRISRIARESGIDLKDPNQRLQIEMLLKAAEIEQLFRQ